QGLVRSDRVALRRLVLTVDSVALVPEALAEATAHFGTSEFDVWVDERGRAARLTSALGLAGFEPIQDTVVLRLVDPSVRSLAPKRYASRTSSTMTDCERGWRSSSEGSATLRTSRRRRRRNRRCRFGRLSGPCAATSWRVWAPNQSPCSATTQARMRWCSSWPRASRFATGALHRTCSPGGVNNPQNSG